MKRLVAGLALLAGTTAWGNPQYFGTYDCGQWFSPDYSISSRAWLDGYLSGINLEWNARYPQSDPLRRLPSAAAADLWMDGYCRANPLERLATGGALLFKVLVERERANK